MATWLGRSIRYVTDSVKYGLDPFIKSAQAPFRDFFRGISYQTGGSSSGDTLYYLRLAATNPYVFSCLTTIADRIKGDDLFIMQKRKGDEWIDQKDHPLPALLAKPNAIMPGSLLNSDTAWWYGLLGNGYWLLQTPNPGRAPITAIWPIPANLMQPEPSTIRRSPITGDVVIDYRYHLTGQILPGENIIHFRTANPSGDYWQGLAPLSALTDNLTTHAEKKGWLRSFFGKGNAVPTAIVSVPPTLSNEDFDDVVSSLEEQFGGKRRTAVVRSGDMNVQMLQQTMQEMTLIDSFKYDKEEVRGVYKIPDGLQLATSGKDRQAAETALARDVIQPLLDDFAAFINLGMVRYYEDPEEWRCIAKNVIPQDRELDIAETNAYAPFRTINEVRKSLKDEPLTYTGILAPLQPLLDQVPGIHMDIIAPILVAQIQAQMGGQVPNSRVIDIINNLLNQTVGNMALGGRMGQFVQQEAPRMIEGQIALEQTMQQIQGPAQKALGEGLKPYEIVAALYAAMQRREIEL